MSLAQFSCSCRCSCLTHSRPDRVIRGAVATATNTAKMAGGEKATRSSRPKRHCAKTAARPNESHYIGYVDDEETTDAIMQKFAVMDKVRRVFRAVPGQQ